MNSLKPFHAISCVTASRARLWISIAKVPYVVVQASHHAAGEVVAIQQLVDIMTGHKGGQRLFARPHGALSRAVACRRATCPIAVGQGAEEFRTINCKARLNLVRAL